MSSPSASPDRKYGFAYLVALPILRSKSIVLVVLTFSIGWWPTAARAACDAGLSTCIEPDTYWPHAGPAYFNIVGSTSTTAPGRVGFGWATTYAARPIVLVLPSPQPSGTEADAVRHLWNATFLFSYGFTERIEATLAMPTTLYRAGTGISSLTHQSTTELTRSALRDIRAGFTFALLPRDRPLSLATRLAFALPTGDESSFSGEGAVATLPSIAGEYRQAGLVLGAELGARFRRTSDLAGTRVGSQMVFALGMGGEILPGNKLGVLVEAIMLPTLARQHELSSVSPLEGRAVTGERRPLMPVEWLASVRTAELMSGDMSLSLGAGGPLGLTGESGITSPSFRVTLVLRYAPRARAAQ